MPGPLRERLERELNATGSLPAQAQGKCKVTAPSNTMERRFGVWIGEPGLGMGAHPPAAA